MWYAVRKKAARGLPGVAAVELHLPSLLEGHAFLALPQATGRVKMLIKVKDLGGRATEVDADASWRIKDLSRRAAELLRLPPQTRCCLYAKVSLAAVQFRRRSLLVPRALLSFHAVTTVDAAACS